MHSRSSKFSHLTLSLALSLAVPVAAHAAATVEVLENYSPVRAAAPTAGQFLYASPSFVAYRGNVMAGLIAGLDAFGPENSPERFQAFDKTIFSVRETTGTPFNSWLGNTAPTGAFAGEFGTIVRAAVRVESDSAFDIGDVLYRYNDDIGNNISATFAGLGFRFSSTFVGRRADGTLLMSAADDPLQDIVGLYFFGFANINVVRRIAPADFAASGQTPDDFYQSINDLYVGDPYSFSDSYALILNGATVASDALAGDIVSGIPEPATWSLLIGGFAATGVALRRRAALA